MKHRLLLSRISLHTRFSLILTAIFIVGLIASWIGFTQILQDEAEEEMTYRGTAMMGLLSSVRNYTSDHIAPLLERHLSTETDFVPEAIPAYAVHTVFQMFTQDGQYSDLIYKEASLNPKNPDDLANDFEAKIIEAFQNDYNLTELSGFATINNQLTFYVSRPLVLVADRCLRCHGDPQDAPASMLEAYGSKTGFGWELGQVVAARTVYVPAHEVFTDRQQALSLVMFTLIIIFVLVIFATNVLLRRAVVNPVVQVARLAQLIQSDRVAPDLPEIGIVNTIAQRKDELGDTARAMQRMVADMNNRVQRKGEEKFRDYIESAPLATVIIDSQGQIVLVNKAAEQLFGCARASLIGHPARTLMQDGQDVQVDESATPGNSLTLERDGRRQDGTVFPAEIHLSHIQTPDERMVLITLLDITRRKEAETALKQALQQEKELVDLKSGFITIASHEFRTPLAAILAITETLQLYRHKMEDDALTERLSRIRYQATHMRDIMEEVLELDRMRAGRVRLKPAAGNFAALCKDIVEEFDGQNDYRGRINYTSAAASIPATFDPRMLRQVISNLVHNALKYSVATTPISVHLTHSEGQITLQVRDSGIGIPAADLAHLFQPFYRASNVGVIAGTGLGLSITRQAVEMHGGTITVQSEVGVGTTFTLVLPTQPVIPPESERE